VKRIVAVVALASQACGRPCGDATYVTGGDALAKWDVDGDGATADLVERCGADWGSFGLRRPDLGTTSLLFDPEVPSFRFEESLELATYLLPAASVIFYTHHLEEGAVIPLTQLGGFGLSKLEGTIAPGYATYALLDGEITVVAGPRTPGDIVSETSNTESWKFRWHAEFGDPQSGVVLQTWDAEDWIDVSDGTTVGDEPVYPADWTGPMP
jgi:hypothetical protein